MHIPFLKVQGTGNDFVLVDGRRMQADWAALALALCDRHFGVGSDGLLVVAESERAPVRMRMWNPDGSEAEMCGNGLRCFVKYVVESGDVVAEPQVDGSERLLVETGAGLLEARFRREGGIVERVRLSMGVPIFDPARIPVLADGPGPVKDLRLTVEDMELTLTCVSMGNPHAIAFLDQPVDEVALDRVGPALERHARFPQRTNFEIVNVVSRQQLRARVWERGAGLTLASGTGACAVHAAARLHGLTDARATLTLPGGDLEIEWDGEGPVFLEGAAAVVFEGEWTTDGHS